MLQHSLYFPPQVSLALTGFNPAAASHVLLYASEHLHLEWYEESTGQKSSGIEPEGHGVFVYPAF